VISVSVYNLNDHSPHASPRLRHFYARNHIAIHI
jgi:hypothetical protein